MTLAAAAIGLNLGSSWPCSLFPFPCDSWFTPGNDGTQARSKIPSYSR